MKANPSQPRDDAGRYDIGKMETPCLCGHTLAVHTAAAPHECLNSDRFLDGADGQPCECARFRARR